MNRVPRRSALLAPRTAVNIILKADQPTGKLTRGIVADILTKGDHPRGVKVRLENGLIGRVQSLASSSSSVGGGEQAIPTEVGAGAGQRTFRFQEDFRKTEPPPPSDSASLADYIKAPPRNKKNKKGRGATTAGTVVGTGSSDSPAPLPSSSNVVPGIESGDTREQMSDQARLEAEFPALDSALVAAILGDGSSVDEARSVLASLS